MSAHELDARGLRCPLPLLRARKALIQADIDTRCRLRMWFDHCLLRDVSIALEED